jgi:single-stranded DNA-binding protein
MRTFTIAGYLGTDLELKTKDDTTWTQLRVATNDGRRTDWFWVTAFGKLAEIMVEKLGKGDGVAIRGFLRVDTYKDEEQVKLIAREADFFPKSR